MEGESKTPAASASDVGVNWRPRLAVPKLPRPSRVAGFSALPAEEAVVSSADLVQWSGQVESEVHRVASRVEEISGSLSSRVHEITGSLSSVRGAVATCSL